MIRYLTYLRIALTLSIVLIGVSASQADQYGSWYSCNGYYYYYPACSTVTVSTPTVQSIPAVNQPMASTVSPPAYTVMKPVINDNAAVTIPQSQSYVVPQSQFYAPASNSYSYPSSGSNATPRSSWDFGKFPPYH